MRPFGSVSVFSIVFAAAAFNVAIPACSPSSSGTVGSNGGTTSGTSSSHGGAGGTPLSVSFNLGGASGGNSGSGGETTAPVPVWPPAGFVNVTNVTFGAYATDQNPLTSVGGASGQGGDSGGSSGSSQCAGLFGVVRDFQMDTGTGGHPDFQLPTPGRAAETGIVTDTLGDDGKPVYANPPAGGTTSTKDNFDQWYRDVDGVNIPYVVGLHFVANPTAGNGVVTFAASLGTATTTPGGGPGRNRDAGVTPTTGGSSYFPVDGLGWKDNAAGDDGKQHNFAFTTEIHTTFMYNGGEKFTFQGDDDVWVYINKKLAIDLGGIHSQLQATVDLDAQASTLGISTGNSYDLAVFNAERHTTQSNFRIDTTLVFTDCGKIDGVIY